VWFLVGFWQQSWFFRQNAQFLALFFSPFWPHFLALFSNLKLQAKVRHELPACRVALESTQRENRALWQGHSLRVFLS
jgi:hypothetical protein